MGFMYGMIIADIFYLLFLIIGLFGAYQYRVNYVAAVSFLFATYEAYIFQLSIFYIPLSQQYFHLYGLLGIYL